MARSHRLDESREEEGVLVAVSARIASVDPDRLSTVGLTDRCESDVDLFVRGFPANWLPRSGRWVVAAANHWRCQSVWVIVQRAKRGALGAEEPLAKRIVFVASNEPVALSFVIVSLVDFQPTCCFA